MRSPGELAFWGRWGALGREAMRLISRLGMPISDASLLLVVDTIIFKAFECSLRVCRTAEDATARPRDASKVTGEVIGVSISWVKDTLAPLFEADLSALTS